MSFANSVILYNCKINHNGLFNCDFGGSGATRDSVMGVSNSIATVQRSYGNCTYMRKDKTIMIDENADVLDNLGINYCRYINGDFDDSRYFYAFVERIEYVAPKSSRLYLKTDVFMTWFDRIEWGHQFVEKANVGPSFNVHSASNVYPGGLMSTSILNDIAYNAPICYGSHPMPLNFSFLPYDGTDNNGWILINLAKSVNTTAPGYQDVSPNVSGLPQGTYWFVVNPTELSRFLWIIDGPQSSGSTPTRETFTTKDILAMYYIPRGCISINNVYSVREEGAGAECNYFDFTVAQGWQGEIEYSWTIPGAAVYMLNGYDPSMEVLLRYPYNYINITDRNGHNWIFKPEMFEWSPGQADLIIKYRVYFSIGDTVSLAIKITNYMEADTLECNCVFQNFPQIPVLSDAYQNYLALNKNSLQNQKQWANYDLTFGLVENGVKAYSGYKSKNASGMISGLEGMFNSVSNYERTADTLNAKMTDMKSYPSSVVCSGSGNLNMLMNTAGLFIEYWSIDPAAAAKIDQVFDHLGYDTNSWFNTPVYRIKALYGYVKTKNCHITGVIPESDRIELDNLFNDGMTVWRSATGYGDYDYRNNNII